jgi:hypothetical protein
MARKPAEENKDAAPAAKKRRRHRAADAPWRPPPLPWILAAGCDRPAADFPARILGANLPEAFLIAGSLKDSEVVAIDTSEKLVRAARTSAARRRLRNLRIEQASLDQPALGELTGGNFNVIVAHDVFHRCNNHTQAWRNLSAACAPRGSVYVSLRGASHPSHRFAGALAAFGLGSEDDSDDLPEVANVQRLLAGLGGFLAADADELKGEISALTANDWILQAADAGLHLRATTLTSRFLPRALAGGGTRALASFKLPKLASFLDEYLCPASLELVFAREAPCEPPWCDPGLLADWIPVGRFLPLGKLEVMNEPWDALATVDVEIHGVLEPQSFTLSRYMVELLRCSDGQTPLGELMKRIPHETKPADLVGGLHFLHHAFILELLPPGK